MRDKIYFVSDVHLGFPFFEPKERESLFVSFLETARADAQAVYLAGDIFDFWFEYKHSVPKGFVRTLGKLAQMCDEGINIYFTPGNHDVWTFGYLEDEIGIKVLPSIHRFESRGKQFLVAHGDYLEGFEPEGSRRLYPIFHNPMLQRAFRMLHPYFGLGFGKIWSAHSRMSKDHRHPFQGENEPSVKFARSYKDRGVDYFVIGHYHLGIQYPLSETSCVCVLGDWIGKPGYAVFDGVSLELKSLTN